MNARGLLEICKALGQVEVTPGFMLFTKDFLRVGRTVDLGSSHRVQVKKAFPSLLDATLETAKEMGYADDSSLFFPETKENNRI